MGLLQTYIAVAASVFFVGVFSIGCGGVDPASEEKKVEVVASGEKDNRVGKQKQPGREGKEMLAGDGGIKEEVELGSTDGQDEFDKWDEDGANGVVDEVGDEKKVGCEQMCVMLAQCHDLPAGVADLDDCLLGCEQSREEGVLMDRDIRCVDAAESCRDLWSCMQNFWACDEPCDSFMSCELQDEPDECRQWCGVGIGSGTVVVEQFHCMERMGRMQICSEIVAECGLDWMM